MEFPRAIVAGLVIQYLAFPLLTLALIYGFQPPVSVALGMVLVSMCPSGNMTNFLVHLAKANVALSITLNTIIILAATVVTPTGFMFWSQYVPESDALRNAFQVGFVDMARIITLLIGLPLVAGMALYHYAPEPVARFRPWAQRLSLVLFFVILVLALLGNRDNLTHYLGFVFVLVLVHNVVALSVGYAAGRIAALPEQDCRTLAFEAGVHNTALGLLLIFRFFDGLGGMALLAAWWGIWDLLTGVLLAWYWRNRL